MKDGVRILFHHDVHYLRGNIRAPPTDTYSACSIFFYRESRRVCLQLEYSKPRTQDSCSLEARRILSSKGTQKEGRCTRYLGTRLKRDVVDGVKTFSNMRFDVRDGRSAAHIALHGMEHNFRSLENVPDASGKQLDSSCSAWVAYDPLRLHQDVMCKKQGGLAGSFFSLTHLFETHSSRRNV